MKTLRSRNMADAASLQPQAQALEPRRPDHARVNAPQSRNPTRAIHCLRCGGLMSPERCYSVNADAGEGEVLAWRCLQCGELVDPIILRNRLNPLPAPSKRVRPARPGAGLGRG